MFTTEFDHDEVLITILDDTDFYEDVQFVIFDDIVYIRQWSDEFDRFQTITVSPEMFDQFLEALNLPEGAYITKKVNK